MIMAERIYRDTLYEAEKRGVACADVGTLAAGLLGEVLYELNDAAGALALLEPRLDVLEQVSIPDTTVRVMLTMCRSRWLLGRPLDALDGLEQAQEQAERSGLDRVLAYCFLEQLQFRLMRRELSAARLALEGLQRLDKRHACADAGLMSEIRMVANRGRIRIAMYTGEMDQALTMLESLTRLCQIHGRARRVPYLLLQSAVVERELGRYEAAQRRVREALQLGHNLGLVRSMLDAHQDVPSLLQEAQADPLLDPVLLFYAERLEAAVRDTSMGSNLHIASTLPGLEVLSPREAEIVRILLHAQSNKKIARVLDLSLNTVKWHLKNIYTKQGVSGRDQVIERLRG
jgi:LuxR family maltose regulon positive regulatory protein